MNPIGGHRSGADLIEPGQDNARLNSSTAKAERRRTIFLSSIPSDLSRREHAIARTLALDNASPQSKLRKISRLIEEFSSLFVPFVACEKGCSSCCRMNITISKVEADYIHRQSGRSSIHIAGTRAHRLEEFLGKPCPFLSQNTCTIYEFRPYVCRKDVSFDTTSYWCEPSRALYATLPMVGFSGIDDALSAVTGKASSDIVANIRDFFPDQTCAT